MAGDFLRRIGTKFFDHVLDFAEQTALGGPKYFINRGAIKGAKDTKTDKSILLKMTMFDRLVGANFYGIA